MIKITQYPEGKKGETKNPMTKNRKKKGKRKSIWVTGSAGLPTSSLGLVVGGVIDMMSGGAYNLEPDPVYASLECESELNMPLPE